LRSSATDVVTTRLAPPHSDAALKLAILVAFLVWARQWVGLSWEELGLARAKVGSGFRVGVLAALVVAAAIFVLVAVPWSRSYFQTDRVAADSTAERFLEPLVFIPIGTVVFEEVIFRGVLLGVLLRSGPRRRAVVVSSALFGLWHLPPAFSDASGKGTAEAVGVIVGTIAVTTVAGVLFAWLRIRSGSLVAPILGHIATNSFAYVGAVVALHL
jgi:membrane protease YdiL (CAAX protease family)